MLRNYFPRDFKKHYCCMIKWYRTVLSFRPASMLDLSSGVELAEVNPEIEEDRLQAYANFSHRPVLSANDDNYI